MVITVTGRAINSHVTEDGRYAGSIFAETGEQVQGVQGYIAVVVASPQVISAKITASIVSAVLFPAWPTLSANVGISALINVSMIGPLEFYQSGTLSAVADFDAFRPVTELITLAIQPDFFAAAQALTASLAVPVQSASSSPLEMSALARAALLAPIFTAEPQLAISAASLVMDKHVILSTLAAPLNMGLESVIMPAPVYTVFVNNMNINNLISGAEIKQDLTAAHASFNFSSISQELFNLLIPPEPLTITINGVAMEFVLEEIGMAGGLAFNAWGRSAGCLLDTPHHDQVTIETDGTQTAAELAVSLGVTVWNAPDYPLPEGWSMTGTPIEIVVRLAATVGAIVQPDGFGVKVLPRFPVRPVNWRSSPPAVSYFRESNILSLSWDDEGKTPWNSIEVTGRSESWTPPILELEESSPPPGVPVHIRIFRKGTSETQFENMVTAGKVVLAEVDIPLIIQEESVQFTGYRASLRYPVVELLSFYWVGDSRGDIYWLDGGRSTELELAPGSLPDLEGCGLAKVTYRTSYERYLLHGHNVPELMLICSQPDAAAVRVRLLVDGQIAPQAPAIVEELATTEAAAVAVGTAWLDANRYNERTVAISAPHEATALPGVVVSLADEIEDVSGPGMVTGRTINITGPAVIDNLEVIQCLS